MRDGSNEGMQYFDGELEKLLRAGTIDRETCMSFATNPGNLSLQIADLDDPVLAELNHGAVSLPPGHAAERSTGHADNELELEVERSSAH